MLHRGTVATGCVGWHATPTVWVWPRGDIRIQLSSAQLSSAQLSSAQLSSAQLSSAQLSSAQLSSAQRPSPSRSPACHCCLRQLALPHGTAWLHASAARTQPFAFRQTCRHCTPFCSVQGGELFGFLADRGFLAEPHARFYVAQAMSQNQQRTQQTNRSRLPEPILYIDR